MKEIRNYNLELRSDPDSRTIEGYALTFNSRSKCLYDKDLGYFYEEILPDSLNGVLERSDILALFNHDQSYGILARSERGQGNLELEVDDKGLYFRFDALKNEMGNTILEYLRNGIVKKCSFAFTTNDTSVRRENGEMIRTINHFDQLYDVSLVVNPAYDSTSCKCRSIDEFLDGEAKKIEEEKRAKEEYYNKLLKSISK